jgi:uncharacterized membrane protein YfcA
MINVLFFILAFLAEVIGTMAGFGSSTILLPISLFFFNFRTALIIVAIFHISGNIGRITFFRQSVDKKLLFTFGVPSVIMTLVGALLVNQIPQAALKFILGLFLIGYVYTFRNDGLVVKPSNKNSLLGGSLSGFFAGLIGTGGALRGSFLTSFKLEKSLYIATASVISLAVDITRIPIYLEQGFLPRDLFHYVPILFSIAITGSYLGKKIVHKIPQKKFRKMVLAAIGLVSLKFIYEGINFFIPL